MTRSSDRTLLQTLGFNDPDKGNEEHDFGCRYLIQPEPMAKLVDLLWPPERVKHPWWDCDDSREKVQHTDLKLIKPKHKGHTESVVQRVNASRWGERTTGSGYHIGFLDALISPAWEMSATRHTWRRLTKEEIEQQMEPEPETKWQLRHRMKRTPAPEGEESCDVCNGGRRYGPLIPSPKETLLLAHQECSDLETQASVVRSEWEARLDAHRKQWIDPKAETVAMTTHPGSKYRDGDGGGKIGVEVKVGKVPIGTAIRQIKLYGSYCPDVSRWVLATRYTISRDDQAALKNEGILHIRLAAGFDAYLESQRNAPEAESPEL